MAWKSKSPKRTISDEVRDSVESENGSGGGNLFDLGTFGGTNVVGVGPGGGGSINIGSNGSMHTNQTPRSAMATAPDPFHTVLNNLNSMGANITPGKISNYTPSHLTGHSEVHVFSIPDNSFTKLEGMLEDYVDNELNLSSREMDDFYRTDKHVQLFPSAQNPTQDLEDSSIFVCLGPLDREWDYMKGMLDKNNLTYAKVTDAKVALIYDYSWENSLHGDVANVIDEENERKGLQVRWQDLDQAATDVMDRLDTYPVDLKSGSSRLRDDKVLFVVTYGLPTDVADLKLIEEAVTVDNYDYQFIA